MNTKFPHLLLPLALLISSLAVAPAAPAPAPTPLPAQVKTLVTDYCKALEGENWLNYSKLFHHSCHPSPDIKQTWEKQDTKVTLIKAESLFQDAGLILLRMTTEVNWLTEKPTYTTRESYVMILKRDDQVKDMGNDAWRLWSSTLLELEKKK